MKMAPILRALKTRPELRATLIHTGQHYDANLSEVFFEQLEMPRPDIYLEVGSGTHAQQTARVLERMEEALGAGPRGGGSFARLVVVGDVNSTLAATLAAVKLGVPVAHVEAGLRSRDRSMPEEINRLMTDAVADMLLVSEPDGVANLRAEGHPDHEIHLVGNVMIDTLMSQVAAARRLPVLAEYGLEAARYGLVTLHRPSNVDDPQALRQLISVLAETSARLPIVFPIHPRTRAKLEAFGLSSLLHSARGIRCLPPLGYREFLCLSSQAQVIVTDSGGLQEETTALGIPCLTMRDNTERPITVIEGTSTLIGSNMELLREQLKRVLAGQYKKGRCPEFWDGNAGERIVRVLAGED